MRELENKIIELANSIPMTYGQYRLIDPLYLGIAKIMGYKITTFGHGRQHFSNMDELEKVKKIIAGMERKGIIKKSKSGQAYKIVK